MIDPHGRRRMGKRLLVLPLLAIALAVMVFAWGSSTDTAQSATGGAEMGMRVDAADTQTCPETKVEGETCVAPGATFHVIISADAIPLSGTPPGYRAAQVWIDWGATGLIFKPNPAVGVVAVTNWPDCNVAEQGLSGATFALQGCLTGFSNPPPSLHKGDLYTFEFNCTSGKSQNEIDLIPSGVSPADTNGALFGASDPSIGFVVVPAKTLTIQCLGPTPTPTSTPIPDTPTPTVSPTPTDTPTPLPPPSERPDVSVTKVDLTDPVDATATFTYRVTVSSVGLQTAEGVVVTDTLPPGTTYVSAVSAGANCAENAGTVTCTVKNPMAPTDEVTIDITVIAPSPVDDTRISNTVTVSSTNEPFANTGNNKDKEETVVLAPRSDVTLTKISDPTFIDGDRDVTYILVAKNVGPHTAVNVIVTDTLPVNATFVSSSNPACGNPVAGIVTCILGNIAPGGESSVNIVMHSPVVTRNIMLKNSAFVTADNELFVQTGNNSAVTNTPVIAPPPDLVVTKTDSADPVLRLGFYSYSITILNQSLGDALDVVVTDTLPTSSVFNYAKFDRAATFVSATGAVCVEIPNGKVECKIDEINAGQQVKITLNVRAPTLLVDQTITNNVTVTASDPDENPAGNDASETTLLRACFDINGDLYVDLIYDILGIIDHFGLVVGDPGFDVIYDFDGDGTVGLIFDILPVLDHQFQDCSLLL